MVRDDQEPAIPRACGRDRVSAGDAPDEYFIDAPHSKGWTPRKLSSRTARPHPGTAIEWEGELWEVIDARGRDTGGIRYRLRRWADDQVVRTRDSYDEPAEQRRALDRIARIRSASVRRTWNATAVLSGHLPAHVQDRMSSEHGTSPAGATLISLIPTWVCGSVALVLFIPAMLGADVGVPIPWLLVGLYLFLESAVRLAWSWNTGRPIGSVAGWVVWGCWQLTTRLARQLSRPKS